MSMRRAKPVPIPVPLLEREPDEIRAALAEYFAVDPEDVRIQKHALGEGRNVAYFRIIWTSWPARKTKSEPRR